MTSVPVPALHTLTDNVLDTAAAHSLLATVTVHTINRRRTTLLTTHRTCAPVRHGVLLRSRSECTSRCSRPSRLPHSLPLNCKGTNVCGTVLDTEYVLSYGSMQYTD